MAEIRDSLDLVVYKIVIKSPGPKSDPYPTPLSHLKITPVPRHSSQSVSNASARLKRFQGHEDDRPTIMYFSLSR